MPPIPFMAGSLAGPALTPTATESTADTAEFFCAADLDGKPIPPRLWHVPDFVPAGTVTTLNGDGGTGKSLAALQRAVATALGRPWLGQDVKPPPLLHRSQCQRRGLQFRGSTADQRFAPPARMPRPHIAALAQCPRSRAARRERGG